MVAHNGGALARGSQPSHHLLWRARCSPPTTRYGREWARLLWHGPTGSQHDRKTGPTLFWRAGNSSTAPTRPTERTCSRSGARPHRPLRWSTRGLRNLGTTTTARTDAAGSVGTTHKSSGATPKRWDAQWREAKDGRCGSA